MTRYSNPLPPNQVPNSQGRPAGSGQQPAHTYPDGEIPGWPQPRAPRPTASAYGDQGGYAPDFQAGGHQLGAHDPYAALRPDGYGYSQPQQPQADNHGLSGYTAPQAPSTQQHYGAPTAYQPSPQQQPPFGAADPYGAANGSYAQTGPAPFGGHTAPSPYAAQPPAAAQPYAYGASQSAYAQPASPPQHSSPFGNGYGAQQVGYATQRADHGHAPIADQWGAQQTLGGGQSLAVDARDYGHAYGNAAQGAHDQWGMDHYGDAQLDPSLGASAAYQGEEAQHASFEQSYAEDDVHYEDEPRRGGWKKVAVLMACTVLLGGGLTFAYSSIMGSGNGESTPVVKGASGPSKVKPSDPGGKQFAHADSKVMGRLGEGGSEDPSDPSGVRKVSVVTVGRDGSIQAPSPTPSQEDTRAVVAVPGLTVIDGLGGPSPERPAAPKAPQQQQASPPVQMVTSSNADPVVVVPPQKQKKAPSNLVGNADPSETGTVRQAKADAADIPAAAPPKKQKVTSLDPAPPAASGPKPTGAGYVAVLASVPASGSSRIDALKQFADMQQKYGVILQNKTPDIQEANLGEKGTYHRLLVGPPGSREAANSVCSQLKAEGYSSCWVTAY
ncbi:SPOR domain-containing protein [Hyphomicrobium sp.]|uniref:SPOR domain-containing protein n=1 Tax=Hyphomicrobium sp. TaxID=82 RepID=UPI002E341EF1|nr:SPOR domain-containing protein [Hyphomicrobium sp.]HEX2843570.1 SPOR domain-containing protein [Hyphomicrobium sp.]